MAQQIEVREYTANELINCYIANIALGLDGVAKTIFHQMISGCDKSAFCSWGADIVCRCYDAETHREGLQMRVNGLQLSGTVKIWYDYGTDTYCVETLKEEGEAHTYNDIYCDELGEFLDGIIEKGNMTDDEYREALESLSELI